MILRELKEPRDTNGSWGSFPPSPWRDSNPHQPLCESDALSV